MKRLLSVLALFSSLAIADTGSFHIVCQHAQKPKENVAYRFSQTVTLKAGKPIVSSFFLHVTDAGKVTSYDLFKELNREVTLSFPLKSSAKHFIGTFAYAQPLAVDYTVGYLAVQAEYQIGQHRGSRIDLRFPVSFSGAKDLNTEEPVLDYKCELID